MENILISDDEFIINNLTLLKSFSSELFILNIKDITYKIYGNDLTILEVFNNNTSIKVKGSVVKIEKANIEIKKGKSFFKRLLD